MFRQRITLFCLVLAMVCALAACGGQRRAPQASGPVSEAPYTVFNGEYENTDALLTVPPRTVAVLPFTGADDAWRTLPTQEDPRAIVRRGMYRHFAALPYKDMELLDTDAALTRAGLHTAEAVHRALDDNPARLKNALGVDAVILGTVTHFDRAYAGLVSQVSVGCTARMVRLSDGALLWQAEHVSREYGGGVSISPIGLAMGAFSSLWNLRDVQLLRETDELFREMAATIATPTQRLAVDAAPPRIDLFAIAGNRRAFREGDIVPLRMAGAPGCSAYARMTPDGPAIAMAPVPQAVKADLRGQLLATVRDRYAAAGLAPSPEVLADTLARIDQLEIYEGTWVPTPQTQTTRLRPRGFLLADTGARAEAVAPAPITIDTMPPPAPQRLTAASMPQGVRLAWTAPDAPDIAAYEIWVSHAGQSGFTKRATVQDTAATLRGLTDFLPVFLRVRTRDHAGNTSGFSPAEKAVPAPREDIVAAAATSSALGGTIDGMLFLPAERGPYTVSAPLEVVPGGELHIGPGAALRFAPDCGLTVHGGSLVCHGAPESPVRLGPNAATARPGTWPGVVLDGAQRSSLSHVTITGAATGLTVRNCAPEVTGLRIEDSSQAGVHLGAGARPSITCTLIHGNGGMGGLVMEGAGCAPRIVRTSFSANTPFDVQSFTPVAVDLTGNHFAAGPDGGTILGRVIIHPALDARPSGCPAP
jgi:hypothetical protein